MTYILLRWFFLALSRIPIFFWNLIVPLLYILFWPIKRREYALVRKNLSLLPPNIRPSVLQTYIQLFINGSISLRVLFSPPSKQLFLFENTEILAKAQAGNKPLLAVSIHSGPFEALHQSLAHTPLSPTTTPWSILVEPLHHAGIQRLMKHLRSKDKLSFYTPKEFPSLWKHFLKKNGRLGILIDQSSQEYSDQISLFGKDVNIRTAILHRALDNNAGIILFRTYLSAKNEIVVSWEEYIEEVSNKQCDQILANTMEKWLIDKPTDWIWNYPKRTISNGE
jgi:lauroyl/myristoyl acyltransferase